MKKFLIFSFIFTLIMICASNFVYASGIDMNLISNTNSDDTLYGSNRNDNTNTNSNLENSSSDSITPRTSSGTEISAGTTAALSSSDLSLSNILNIILIVLGILLILFAIGILIRMR